VKKFVGFCPSFGPHVVLIVEGDSVALLDPRLDLWAHSPSGFCWGYMGSGPAQLALAMLAVVAGDEGAAKYYQRFKADVVARLAKKEWTLSFEYVRDWLIKEALGRPGRTSCFRLCDSRKEDPNVG